MATRTLPDPATEPTITVPRAAAVLDISRRHAYAAAERGEWPTIRIGRSIRIPTARWLRLVGLVEAPVESVSQTDSTPVTSADIAPSHADVTTRRPTTTASSNSPPPHRRILMAKTTRRFTLVFDATFGTDPDDEFDKDENAYPPEADSGPNILAALEAGEFQPGHMVYVELGSDVVHGTLVWIGAEPPAGDLTGQAPPVGDGDAGPPAQRL